MRTLFLDCSFGVSGDMLISSLLCHLDDDDKFFKRLEKIPCYNEIQPRVMSEVKYSVKGKSFEILVQNNLQSRYLNDIINIINGVKLSEIVKKRSIQAFTSLAEAEAAVHGIPVEKVHFHELGALDTIFDVTGFYILLELLSIDKVVNNPVNLGKGSFVCKHGEMSVPGPAVLELLKGRSVFAKGQEGERTTPTGAVLVKETSADSECMPQGCIVSTGYGFGKTVFEDGNYLRSIILDEDKHKSDEVYLLECNIDDMTGEQLGFAFEQLLEAGVLDVWQQPVFMKKNRMGTKMSVLCRDAELFCGLIFKHTSTLGIRVSKTVRAIRGESKFTSKNGIRIKITGDIIKPEFEDVKRKALEEGMSLNYIYKKLEEDNEH